MKENLIVNEFANLDDIFIVKRVIGLPGEKLWIVGGNVCANSQPLKEKYIRQKSTYSFNQLQYLLNSTGSGQSS